MSDQTTQRPNVPRGGSIPAGLEEPPRIRLPDLPPPSRPEVRQTYDPRVSVQLERAARDRAAGQPGTAAHEDLERAPGDVPVVRVEGIPPRETVVTFSTQFASYFAGETAAFTPEEAERLAELGVTGDGGTAPTEAPVNTAVPAVTQAADVLSCTMGTWTGTPSSYAYQWQIDGTNVGTDASTYTRLPADVGLTATCVVTATNAIGSTAAPPSVGVVVT
jgi:hypothetical protein